MNITKSLSYRFPLLVQEWDFDKNTIRLDDVTYGSHKRVWWKCKVCAHSWRTYIFNRTTHKSGCPACSRKAASSSNNLEIKFPGLLEEWDYVKNKKLPKRYSPYSAQKVWWVCKKCRFNWRTLVYSRTKAKTGCPMCANMITTKENNLSFLYPEVASEWDYSRNKIEPDKVMAGSGKKVWWVCNRCEYSWKTRIVKRTISGQGCSECSKGSSVSVASQEWLDFIEVGSDSREVFLKNLGFRVDGFDPKTNTVYEFLGDFWHGNPEVFPPWEINPINKKSYGQLHQETLERIETLKENGYKVIYIWEKDFNRKNK